jgi:hypothetical protein
MIAVKPLHQQGKDERGATYIFDNDRTGQFIIAYRKAGSVSGREYHVGKTAYKNPEKLVLMQGKALFNWKNLENNESGNEQVNAPVEITIPAMIWHEMVAVTDVILLELNSIADCAVDTIKLIETEADSLT